MADYRGGRLLAECEEESLDVLLSEVRQTCQQSTSPDTPVSRTGISGLDTILTRAPHILSMCGITHGLPLLYHILNTSISSLHHTVAILDFSSTFQPTHLTLSWQCLEHIYIFRPSKPADLEELTTMVSQVREYMIYGDHGSRGREFLGVVVIDAGVGASGSGADFLCGWRGMMKVMDEREEILGFGMGMSVEEALSEREVRHVEVEKKGWIAKWEGGSMRWDG